MEVIKCKQTHEFGLEDYYDKVNTLLLWSIIPLLWQMADLDIVEIVIYMIITYLTTF